MIKIGLLIIFGIWLGFGSYWTFGSYSRVDYNNELRNGGEKLICSSRLSRARLGKKKVDSILASVPNDGQFNCIRTWRLSDSLRSQSNYCPQYVYLFSFSTIIFVSNIRKHFYQEYFQSLFTFQGWLIFIVSVIYLKVVSSSPNNDIIENSKGQIVELPPIPTNIYDHKKPREATAIALDTKYKEHYEHVKVPRPKYQPPEPPTKISA